MNKREALLGAPPFRLRVEPQALSSHPRTIGHRLTVDPKPFSIEIVIQRAAITAEHHHAPQPVQRLSQGNVVSVSELVRITMSNATAPRQRTPRRCHVRRID